MPWQAEPQQESRRGERDPSSWWGGFQTTLSPRLTPDFPLQHAAKQAAASATQTIAAAQHAAASNKNPAAQQQLVQSCKVRGTGQNGASWWEKVPGENCSYVPSFYCVCAKQPYCENSDSGKYSVRGF